MLQITNDNVIETFGSENNYNNFAHLKMRNRNDNDSRSDQTKSFCEYNVSFFRKDFNNRKRDIKV